MIHDQRCCTLLVEFWQELAFPKPNDQRVRELADAIGESKNVAHTSYKRLLSLRADDVHVTNLYSGFLCDIANDPEAAAKMNVR